MSLTLADALRLAAKDPTFAKALVQDPESFKQQFNLSDDQIAKIKATSIGEVLDQATAGDSTVEGYYD